MTILELRKLTGLSQRKFADKYHLGIRNVQNWEQGVRKPPTYVLYLLEKLIELENKR